MQWRLGEDTTVLSVGLEQVSSCVHTSIIVHVETL